MFNNFVTARDFGRLFSKLARGQWGAVWQKLRGTAGERVGRAWSHTETPPTNWWDVPAVVARWNRTIAGDPALDCKRYLAQKYLADGPPRTALSLACGAGAQERAWARLGVFSRIDACDLSGPRIVHANERAAEEGLGQTLRFEVGNVYDLAIPEGSLDVVLAEGALHHLTPLDEILRRAHGWLKPGGYLLANEFVGPTRFQWTDRQLEEANALLSSLPERYRIQWDGAGVKKRIYRPSRLAMILTDPSEAVESGRILALLEKRFEVVERRDYGGTLLQLVLGGVAHHFIGDDDAEAQRLLRRCFETEDRLLAAGELSSDFAVIVCRKKG